MQLPADLERRTATFLALVPALTPTYEIPMHLWAMARELMRVFDSPCRAAFSVPPRHSKSELLAHFIALYLKLHPERVVFYIAHTATFSEHRSQRIRDLAIAAGVQMDSRRQRMDEWRTAGGGGLIARGVGGEITGRGADLIIIDDPHKSREEAESPTIREGVWEYFQGTLSTRLEPGGSVFVCHTRWIAHDLIGRLTQEDPRYTHINLPAISARGALWPSRWTASMLEERRREVGEYNWASQFQGEPRPKGGALFTGVPGVSPMPLDLTGSRVVISCDPAATAKTSADYSAVVVLALRGTGVETVADVLEVWRGQLEIPRLVQQLVAMQARYKGAPVLVESVGGFKAVPQSLRALAPSLKVVEVVPVGDKFTRGQPVAAAWNDGRVRLPQDAIWRKTFLQEIQSFTGVGDAHDDQVDALSQAWNGLYSASIGLRRGVR